MDKWKELEKEYGIKLRLKNGDFRPVNEWLDDLHLQLTYSQAVDMIMRIYHSEDLFEDILEHQQ